MFENDKWFEVLKHKDYLYIIRERLDEIDPRFYTKYVNLYLIKGSEQALLIDSGCGLFPLKPIINKLLDGKKLLVFNTHSHFDHRGGNAEFGTVYINEKEIKQISNPLDISFLKDSPKEIVKLYERNNFVLQPSARIKPLHNGDRFDLGDISIEIICTPGHSIGSISILTNRGDLFTGDTAHYGTMYLPKTKEFPIILESISKLLNLFEENEKIEIYPSHEDYCVKKDLLVKLKGGIKNIENIWESRKRDKFLHCSIIEDENFRYLI